MVDLAALYEEKQVHICNIRAASEDEKAIDISSLSITIVVRFSGLRFLRIVFRHISVVYIAFLSTYI